MQSLPHFRCPATAMPQHVLRYSPRVLKITSKQAQIGPSSPYHPHHRPSDHNHPTTCLQQLHVQPLPQCRCPPTTMSTCTPVQPTCTRNNLQTGPNRSKQPLLPPTPPAQQSQPPHHMSAMAPCAATSVTGMAPAGSCMIQLCGASPSSMAAANQARTAQVPAQLACSAASGHSKVNEQRDMHTKRLAT